jgi:hypothetical protein
MKRGRGSRTPTDLRERVADEAARIMIDQGIRDYATAKRKAADRLAVQGQGGLPPNTLIEQRLAERQRVFAASAQPERIREMRRLALELMEQLAEFSPRLVGPVLAGTATPNDGIELHCFSDTLELVSARLLAAGISSRTVERRSRRSAVVTVRVPALRFAFSGREVGLEVHPYDAIRQAPLSPVDQRPMHRAAAAEVRHLIRAD